MISILNSHDKKTEITPFSMTKKTEHKNGMQKANPQPNESDSIPHWLEYTTHACNVQNVIPYLLMNRLAIIYRMC